MKINQLNGPSPIHDTSTWLNQSIQSIISVRCLLGMQKNLPWKCFRTAFRHYDLPSTSASSKPDACANVTTCCLKWRCKFGIDAIFLDFRVIMHDMQALIKKEISPSRMRKYYSGEILFCGVLRADVSKYRPGVYKSEKSKILKKIHKVALGKLLT